VYRSLQRLTANVMRFVDSFMPVGGGNEAEKMRDMRVFLISHIFGPFLGSSVPLSLYVLDPTPGFPVLVLAFSIAAFWLFPPILRRFGHYETLALVSVQNLIFCILWSCYFYGGVASPTLPWVLVIPLLAFFYLGASSRLRFVVLGMFFVNVLAFRLIYWLLPPIANDMPAAAIQGLGITSTVAASLYVAMMAAYYAKVLAHHTELESEMKVHQATASQLRHATQEAERASAAKAEFVARMSHELRTPLNAIIGYSDLLIEEATDTGDDESIDLLGRVRHSGSHLLTLVNKILDLSKIDAGKMELNSTVCDLDGLLEETVASHQADARTNSNTLTLDRSAKIGTLLVDDVKLKQMIHYLLANGLKFTERGTVTVQGRTTRTARGERLQIKVIDTGIGISEKDLSGLFERFSGVQDVTTSKYGGTGLGLALTRRLAMLMNGTVMVESTLGLGSAFTIDIEAVRQTDSASATAEPSTEHHAALAA
jgi:signal transduction histidine kinase